MLQKNCFSNFHLKKKSLIIEPYNIRFGINYTLDEFPLWRSHLRLNYATQFASLNICRSVLYFFRRLRRRKITPDEQTNGTGAIFLRTRHAILTQRPLSRSDIARVDSIFSISARISDKVINWRATVRCPFASIRNYLNALTLCSRTQWYI